MLSAEKSTDAFITFSEHAPIELPIYGWDSPRQTLGMEMGLGGHLI